MAEIAEAKIAGATIGSAQIDDLEAVVAEIIHAQVATGEFDFAEVENFLGSVFILGQGIAGTVSIENLMVTRANMLNATVQTLILPGTDGKYYQITVGTDGQLSTEEVTVTDSEIAAGETEDGRQIVATTINAETINGSTVTAQQAVLNTVLTQALTAGKITAGEALIASASIPTLYVTSVEALGNSMTFSANEQIQMIVGNVQQAQETADNAQEEAEQAAPYISATPPEEAPEAGKLWLDEGVEPSVLRKWRGADVTTEREYTETVAGDADSPAVMLLDNSAGQVQRVAVTAACRAGQAGTGEPSPENIRAITGRESVEIAACGKNLYDVNDRKTFSDGVTVDADGWITVTADNSGGNNTLFRNIFTRPSAALKPDREYTIVCEIASASISVDNANLCLVNGTVSQFVTTKWLANLNAGTQVYVVKTKADFSDCESMLRTYAQYNAGASGTIKFRISVLEDTSITAETFEYEPYQDIPFLALDNAQGQIENVTVEAGCRAKQAGTGEPSPENIRAITGRDSVEIVACGKNLVPIRTTDDTLTGISYHSNGDGSYTVNGTSTGNAAYILLQTVIPPGNYVLSGGSNNVNVHVAEFNADGTWVSSIAMSVNGNAAAVTIQPLPAGHYHRINIGVDLGLQASSVTVYPQLEAGDTATAFEPYRSMGGGTVTPTEPLYGLPGAEDTVEVSVDGDVLVTRRTAVKTLDGTENWWRNAGWAIPGGASVTNILLNAKPVSGTLQIGNLQCSHLMVASANSAVNMNGSLNKVGLGQGTELFINVEGCDTVSSLKSYLADQYAAGTPVTIVYELAAPTTETPADVDPIEPQAGQLNISTDADALSATVHGSGWDTISDQTGLLATIAQLTARVTALEQAAVNSIGG